jgi:Carboxypeptidase regulatory-like domain
MSFWRGLVVVFLVLLGCGVWWFVQLEPSAARAPLPPPAAEGELAIPAASSLESSDANTRTKTEATTLEAATTPPPKPETLPKATLHARCVDENAKPIADVEVLRYDSDLLAHSDGDGRIECPVPLVRAGPISVQLTLRERFHLSQTFKRVLSEGQVCELGEVVMPRGARILGRVLDPEGKPCAKASVVTTHISFAKWHEEQERDSITATTAEDGSFALDGVPAGTLRVAAFAEGYVTVEAAPLEVLAGQELRGVQLAFVAKEEVDESGLLVRVLQPSGEPYPGAYISCEWRDGEHSSMSFNLADAKGEYRIRSGPGGAVDIAVTDPAQRFPNACVLAVPISRRTLDIRLEEGSAHALRVVDEQAAPVETYALRVLDETQYHPVSSGAMLRDTNGLLRDLFIGHGLAGPYAPRPQERKAHAGGRAEIHTGSSAFVVQVDAAGFSPGEAGPFLAGEAQAELRLVLKRLPGIRGRIVSAGQPVAGAWVRLFKATREGDLVLVHGFASSIEPVVRAETKSAADGSFQLPLRDAGKYVVQAGSAELGEAESAALALRPSAGAEGIVLELPALGAIEGRLLVAPDESARDRVVGASRGSGNACSVRTDAEGRFRIAKLTPGNWRLHPFDEDVDPAGGFEVRNSSTSPTSPTEDPAACKVRSGETTRIDIDLRRKAVLVARVELAGWEGGKWSATLEPVGATFSRKATQTLVSLEALRLSVDQPGDYALNLEVAKPEQHGYLVFEERVHLDAIVNTWTLAGAVGQLLIVNTLAQTAYPTLVCDLPGGRHATFALNLAAHEEATIQGVPLGNWTGFRYEKGQRIDEGSIEVTAGAPARMEWK